MSFTDVKNETTTTHRMSFPNDIISQCQIFHWDKKKTTTKTVTPWLPRCRSSFPHLPRCPRPRLSTGKWRPLPTTIFSQVGSSWFLLETCVCFVVTKINSWWWKMMKLTNWTTNFKAMGPPKNRQKNTSSTETNGFSQKKLQNMGIQCVFPTFSQSSQRTTTFLPLEPPPVEWAACCRSPPLGRSPGRRPPRNPPRGPPSGSRNAWAFESQNNNTKRKMSESKKIENKSWYCV